MVQEEMEVFTIPVYDLCLWTFLDKGNYDLRDYRILSGSNSKMEEVRLNDYGEVEFLVRSKKLKHKKVTELKRKLETSLEQQLINARLGRIRYEEAFDLAQKSTHSDAIKLYRIKAVDLLTFYFGRPPNAGRRLSRVELVDDEVKFTLSKT